MTTPKGNDSKVSATSFLSRHQRVEESLKGKVSSTKIVQPKAADISN